MFYSKNPAPPNYTRFSDEQYDQLYHRAMKTTSITEKIHMYNRMDNILVEEAPVVFLFYDEVALFARKNIKGLSLNAQNLLQVKNIVKN